jgi:hypothetical protein
VGHQRLGRHAAIDRPLRRRGHHHGALAGPAGIARAPRDAHPQLRGHDVELLGAQIADAVHRTATAGARGVVGVDHHNVVRQMGRQRAVIAHGARAAWGMWPPGFTRILARLVLGNRLLQILEPELQLVRGQLFGAAAELVVRQALD